MLNSPLQNGICERCDRIASLYGAGDDKFKPLSYSYPSMQFSKAKNSSLGVKCYSMMGYFENSTPPTAQSYVQDGLIALYDSKENTGYGQHSNSATSWKNLVYESSNSTDLVVNASATGWWGDNCVNLPGTGEFAYSTYNMVNGISIECCFKIHDLSEGETYADGYCPFMIGNASSAWSADRRRIIVYPRENGMYVNTYQKWLSATTAESKYSYWVDYNPSGIKTIYTYMSTCDFIPENQSFYVNSSDFSTAYCSSGESFPEHPWSYNGQVIRIGLNAWSGDNVPSLPFKGKIYSIRIYNKQLSANQVAQNHSIDFQRYGCI